MPRLRPAAIRRSVTRWISGWASGTPNTCRTGSVVDGNRVFVVTARTPKDALTPEKAWTFYFTEAGGRIYGLTTDAPVEFADRMTNEAERFILSLRAKSK